MDFAPAKAPRAVKKPVPTKVATRPAGAPSPSRIVQAAPKPAKSTPVQPKPVKIAPAKPASAPKPAKSMPALGIVEEINPRNTPSSITKRPLGTPAHFKTTKSAISSVKSQKIGNQKPTHNSVEPVENHVENSDTDKSSYTPPKSPFINLDKVKKRPLSKNVYRKEIEIPKEEPKGPVTIIAKPEKDSHISLIVTVIITIILGAVAGTIAFLLLPK